MDKVIEDKELGRLVVHVNARARRLIFRTKNNEIVISVPPHTSTKEVAAAIEQLRPKLIVAKNKLVRTRIDLSYNLDTPFFKLSLIHGNRDRFLAHSELGQMKIICPSNADFQDDKLQTWLRKVIEEALRRNAKIILPPRLYMLAQKFGFTYESVKINSSKGRWGSCSAKRGINLSYFLVLLPQHLIDYVLLHELCHTREMNHGEKFWSILNSVTSGRAHELREELRKYKTDI